MAVTIERSLRSLLVAIESRRNFEFTIFIYEPALLAILWATSQVSNYFRIEVSLEVMFRTFRNARLSLSSRELFIQIFKWLTGCAMLLWGRKEWLRARKVGVWCWYDIWRGQTVLFRRSSKTY